MKRYEYCLAHPLDISGDGLTEDERFISLLNALGSDGWELLHIRSDGHLLLMRERQDA